MKLISSQFRERAKSDKLYHLKLLIRTTHSNVSLEKNEVITISPYQMNYGAVSQKRISHFISSIL